MDAWQSALGPILKIQDERKAFDIHACGDDIMESLVIDDEGGEGGEGGDAADAMDDFSAALDASDDEEPAEGMDAIGGKGVVAFGDVGAVQVAEPYEICRLFLASLQLANNGNLELIHANPAGETEGSVPGGEALDATVGGLWIRALEGDGSGRGGRCTSEKLIANSKAMKRDADDMTEGGESKSSSSSSSSSASSSSSSSSASSSSSSAGKVAPVDAENEFVENNPGKTKKGKRQKKKKETTKEAKKTAKKTAKKGTKKTAKAADADADAGVTSPKKGRSRRQSSRQGKGVSA